MYLPFWFVSISPLHSLHVILKRFQFALAACKGFLLLSTLPTVCCWNFLLFSFLLLVFLFWTVHVGIVGDAFALVQLFVDHSSHFWHAPLWHHMVTLHAAPVPGVVFPANITLPFWIPCSEDLVLSSHPGGLALTGSSPLLSQGIWAYSSANRTPLLNLYFILVIFKRKLF